MPRFQHPPLASASDEIRLLSLDLSGDLDDIHCTLVTHRFDARPLYCALSYEWGDPDLPMDIKVNGNVFHARHNLWLFLHQLKTARRSQAKVWFGPAGNLWIDALCIDQMDLAERSTQVQLMGRIFREATGVIVWLGWSDGLDPVVTSTLNKEIATHPGYGHEAAVDLLLNGSYQCNASMDIATTQDICKFISELCKKTYWTRRWIVQEILMAKKILLMYGEQQLPWWAVCMIFERYRGFHSDARHSTSGGIDQSLLETVLESTAARIWRHQNMRKNSKERTDLATLLHDYRPLLCEVSHDRIYALLGLSPGGSFDTDYSLSPLELYSRVFGIVLRQDRFAFRRWREYAADCGLAIPPLHGVSFEEQPVAVASSMTHIPLETTTKFYVISSMDFRASRSIVTEIEKVLKAPTTSPTEKEVLYTIYHRLSKALEILPHIEAGLSILSRSAVGAMMLGSNERYTRSPDRVIKKFLSAAGISETPPESINGPPRVIFCLNASAKAVSTIAVTWSHAIAGDVLCKLVGECYIILRDVGSSFDIVGLAWMLLREEDITKVEEIANKLLHLEGSERVLLWERLFSRYVKSAAPEGNSSGSNRDSSTIREEDFQTKQEIMEKVIQLRLDVLELISLLQVTEQIGDLTRLNDWDFPSQSSFPDEDE